MMKPKYLVIFAILVLASILRLYALDKYPSGLNADEAAIGYNAYSLLATGKDEDGHTWPIVFESFGDFKPGGYFYLVLPFVKVLGLNVWAVRLPSALLGILSVGLIYLLAGELSDLSRFLIPKSKFQLFSALLLAISPWHLQFSRGGWETNAATAMILGGVYFFLKSLSKRGNLLYAVMLFCFSMYTYQSTRLIAPVLGLSLVVIFWKHFWPPTKEVVASCLLLLLLLLPLALTILSPSGLSRFSGVGLSADLGPTNRVNELRGQHPNPDSLIVKVIHNKFAAYLFLFGKNYLDHFGGDFLFISGDPIERDKVPEMGQLYLIEVPILLLGSWWVLKKGGKGAQVIFAWVIIAPLAAALTFQTPHALRALTMVIPIVLILAIGLVSVTTWIRHLNSPRLLTVYPAPRDSRKRSTTSIERLSEVRDIDLRSKVDTIGDVRETRNILVNQARKVISACGAWLILLGYLWCFTHYLDEYYIHYPQTYPSAWEYGFAQVAAKVQPLLPRYDRILITDTYDQPYIEMLFFLRYPPQDFQKEVVLTPRDNYGFSTVRTFGKFEFGSINWDALVTSGGTLVIGTPKEIPSSAKIIDTVLFPSGEPAFVFAQIST